MSGLTFDQIQEIIIELSATFGLPVSGVWSSYTPTVTTSSGTITSFTANGRFYQFRNTVFCNITVYIATNGTGAGSLFASLPVTPDPTGTDDLGDAVGCFSGREWSVTGKAVNGLLDSAGGGRIGIRAYDNTYPGVNGAAVSVSGVYQTVPPP